jgi:hydrogenase/urease accessory protein HupE
VNQALVVIALLTFHALKAIFMLQEIRDYWLPMMLFVGTLLVAAVLSLLVVLMPLVAEYILVSNPVLALFVEDATVRRTSIAGAIGLTVTAWVFFRPDSSAFEGKSTSQNPPQDSRA